MKIRKICVLGGSGFVGSHIVHQLAAEGYSVRVVTRNRERAKELIVLPTVDVVEGNVHDQDTLNRLFSGMDAVINLIGILHEQKRGRSDKPTQRRGDFHETHVELARKVIKACAANDVRRLLHMSALNADPNGPSGYLRSKGVAEALVAEAARSTDHSERGYLDGPKFGQGHDLCVTIFRPSVIFGRHDAFLNMFARLQKVMPVMLLACPDARFQPVYVEDVARAFVRALPDTDTFGQRYDLCGPKVYTLRQLVEYAGIVSGYRRPVIGLGPALGRLQAAVLEVLPGKLLTRDNLDSMKVDSVCNCNFPEVFGFAPTPLEAVGPVYLNPYAQREGRYRVFRRNRARREK